MLEKTKNLLRAGDSSPASSALRFDPVEMEELANSLNHLLYAHPSVRSFLQERGVSIVPANFYSEIPTIAEIENSFVNSKLQYCAELFDQEYMLWFLNNLSQYSIEFDPPPKANISVSTAFSWDNGMYSYSDAMSYYAIIRHLKPKNIVEIGSGYSTLVARQALDTNKLGALTCIEPFPQDFLLEVNNIRLIKKFAQEIDVDFLNEILTPGDVLFIDSTHTVKHGSDCLHIYLNILPRIRKEVYVHVHDIYLPSSLPIDMLRDRQIYWTEQYLLGAYLLDNPHAKIVYGSQYHYLYNRPILDQFMHGRYMAGGASLWFRRT